MGACKNCGQEAIRLYGGICAQCMCIAAVSEEKTKLDEEHSLAGLQINTPIKENFLNLYKKDKHYDKTALSIASDVPVEKADETTVSITDELIIIAHKSTPEDRFAGTAEISKMDGIYYGVDGDNVWYFNRLFVPIQLRNKGVAKKLLDKLVEILRDRKMALICEINAYGDLSESQLKKMYSDYGFKDTGKGYMLFDARGRDNRG